MKTKTWVFLTILIISQASNWAQGRGVDFSKRHNAFENKVIITNKAYRFKDKNSIKIKQNKPTLRMINKHQYRSDLHREDKNIPISKIDENRK